MKKVRMKRLFFALSLAIALIADISAPAFPYDKPFILGQGRHLTVEEVKALKDDISKTASDEFKKAYEKGFKEQSEIIGTNKPNIRFIKFIKLDKNMGRTPLERSNKPLFMVSLNGDEGIPEIEAKKRNTTKAEYYDIWVISGHFVLFEKDLKTGKFKFLEAGAAE